jgi:hypothetical protein
MLDRELGTAMERRDRARELIRVALAEVEAERRDPRYQLRPEQLDTCLSTLREYLAALEGGALPPRRQRPEGLGRLVLDSWPYDVPLANAVLQAERAWRNA